QTGPVEINGTVHDAVVGDGHGALSQLLDSFGQAVDPAGSIQEAVLCMDMEVNKGHRRFLSDGNSGIAVYRWYEVILFQRLSAVGTKVRHVSRERKSPPTHQRGVTVGAEQPGASQDQASDNSQQP